MSDDLAKKRDELLKLISNAEADAIRIESKAREVVNAARYSRDIIAPLKPVVKSVPDGAIASCQMNQFIGDLYSWREQAKQAERALTMCNSFVAMTSGVTNTANYALDSFIVYHNFPQAAEAQKRIIEVQDRQPQVEKARSSMQRLGLDPRLLNEAASALSQPPAGDGGSVSVLVSLRECINYVLADLLPRRPNQEGTGKASDKIASIGRQCSIANLTANHFESLGATAEFILHKQLSAAKQQELTREELGGRFTAGLTFLNAFMDGIDATKLRPLKK